MYKNILIDLQDLEDPSPTLSKATALCKMEPAKARIHVVRVVYESLADLKSKYIDDSIELKKFVLEAEEPLLEDAVRQADLSDYQIECMTAWHKHIWEGVIHTADAERPDLILKPRNDDTTRLFPHPPEDWNLIRHAKVPVLLTRSKIWPINPTILAAVDVFDDAHADLNRNVLIHADRLTQALGGKLHIASVFPILGVWINEMAIIKDYDRLHDEMADESRGAINTLCRELDIKDYSIHAKEGVADVAIEQLVKSTKACVLVMGTKARVGLSGYLIGNTAEKILSRVDTDVMTIPMSSESDT